MGPGRGCGKRPEPGCGKRPECPVVYSRSLCARSITLWYMDRTDPAASHPGSESPETGPGFLPAAPADTWPGTPAGTGPQFVPRIPPETGPGLVPWPRTILGM